MMVITTVDMIILILVWTCSLTRSKCPPSIATMVSQVALIIYHEQFSSKHFFPFFHYFSYRNHVVFGRLQSSYHSLCLRVLIGMQLRTNVQGLDGFSNLSEFQFEGNWRWVLYIVEYSCSLEFSDNTLLFTFSH